MTITCPQCKHQNPDDAEFCENCGAQLPVPAPVGTGPNPAGYPSGGGSTLGSLSASFTPGSGPLNQLVCPTCRAPLAPGDEFCFNCGTDVRTLTGPAQGGQPQGNPPSASNGGVDPMAATMTSAPQPPPQGMKDDDIDRALAGLDSAAGPSSDPTNDPTVVGPILVQAPTNQPPSTANTGPEAQPFNSLGQTVTSPPPAQTGGGSVPVQPGPPGGVAGNAFGAPPANVSPVPPNATQPVPVMARPAGQAGGGNGALILQITGPLGNETVEWKGAEILLGRNDAKTRVFPEVNLDDNAASRRHLSVWKDDADGLYYAQDLESANGTLLNGRDLKPGEPTLINDGDVLKIGTRYSIKVQIS
jgi:hypothetical protein